MRLDLYLVEKKLVSTRGQAKVLIEKGEVTVNGKVILKLSFKVLLEDEIKVLSKNYVSRGAYKLLKAIESFKLKFDGLEVADIGASTGGFTEVLLENNVKKVYAIDVGHDQLSSKLKSDPRVNNYEGMNAKNPISIPMIDAFVCDVSFISLKLIFKNMDAILKRGGFGVVLIKPQFEAGKDRIQKNGLVSEANRDIVLKEILTWFRENNYFIKEVIESPIKGNKSKNIEYLALYIKESN